MSLSMAGRRGTRRRSLRRGNVVWAIVFIGPAMLGLGIFYLWPVVRSMYLSLTKSGIFGGSTFVGFDNYVKLASDPKLLQAVLNTTLYTAIVLLTIPLAVGIAALLAQRGLRGRAAYRVIYFLPVVTLPTAVALVWRLIYHGDYGLIELILRFFGGDGPFWLSNRGTVMLAVGIVGIWSLLGQQIVIMSAGMQGISPSLYEAARLDGAGPVREFFSVTVPMLSPSIFFVTVLTVINAFQMFDLAFIMVPPSDIAAPYVRTIVYLFYEAGFVENQRGYAATIAVFLFAIIMILTLIQFRLQRRWVHYE